MATFVLIPGPGTDPWFWNPLASELRARAHSVVPVDLPCEDDAAGLAEYADAVVDAVGELTDLVLVAHSMGGFIAPLVCQRVPVDLIVLLSAMVPAPGEAPCDWPEVPTRFLRLGITADEMPGGHCVPISRPRELADRLEAYRGLVAADRHCKDLRSQETGSGVSR